MGAKLDSVKFTWSIVWFPCAVATTVMVVPLLPKLWAGPWLLFPPSAVAMVTASPPPPPATNPSWSLESRSSHFISTPQLFPTKQKIPTGSFVDRKCNILVLAFLKYNLFKTIRICLLYINLRQQLFSIIETVAGIRTYYSTKFW